MWVRSNMIGSNTMPIRHRSDFKQALSTLRQLEDRRSSKKTKDGQKAILLLVVLTRKHGGLHIPTKVTMKTYPAD